MLFKFSDVLLLLVLTLTCLAYLCQAESIYGIIRSASCPLLLRNHESVRQSKSSEIHRKSRHSSSSSSRVSRIYNGDLGASDLNNYVVGIYTAFGKGTCTGVRIGPSLALSSASCVFGSTIVYLGRNFTKPRSVIETLWNQRFFSITSDERFEYNIGFVRYSEESGSSKTMRISINNSLPEPGSSVRVAGLGYISPNPSTTAPADLDLYTVDLPVNVESDCQNKINAVGTLLYVNYGRQVCAGYGDKDCGICTGDVGGPMFQYDSDGVPVVVGVAAVTFRSMCTGRIPTIAVRTAPYKQDFLDQGLKEGIDLVSSVSFEVQKPNNVSIDTPDDSDSPNNDPPNTAGGSGDTNNSPSEENGSGVSVDVIIGAVVGGGNFNHLT